jgi:hypothetical protein
MHEVPQNSLLSVTGQTGALKLAALGAALGVLIAGLAPLVASHEAEYVAAAMFIVGAILLLIPAWVVLRNIRCPRCGARWLQHALGSQPISNWAAWLFSFDTCPECHVTSRSITSQPPSNKSQERTREG